MEEKMTMRARITENLRKKIAGMDIDEALPSELRLAEYYNASRTTIRLAVGDLINEGLLYRIKGSGTYKQAVRNNGLIPGSQIIGFTAELKKVYTDVHLEDISIIPVSLPTSKAHLLGVAVGSKGWKFSRKWVTDGKPFAYGIAYFRRDLMPEFDKSKLHLSLLETLQEEYGHKITEIDNNMMAKMPDEMFMDKLNIQEGQPLLICESILKNDYGQKLYVDTRYHSADNYVYCIRQSIGK